MMALQMRLSLAFQAMLRKIIANVKGTSLSLLEIYRGAVKK